MPKTDWEIVVIGHQLDDIDLVLMARVVAQYAKTIDTTSSSTPAHGDSENEDAS